MKSRPICITRRPVRLGHAVAPASILLLPGIVSLLSLAACAAIPHATTAAVSPQSSVVDDDVVHFWEAYDAVRSTTDPAEQRARFQRLYIDRGTPGLHAFMQAKGYTIDTYLEAIRSYPAYWASIRPRTALARVALTRLEAHLVRFRRLYPGLRPAIVYFEVGALRSAGTTLDDKVLIGVEMATGDSGVDTSQMPDRLQQFFARYFASRPLENLDLLSVHEFVHTQQRGERHSLLAQAVYEGVADFVAEQVTGRLPDLPYISYGPAHDDAIRTAFRQDMLGSDYTNWLYNNTDNRFGTRDLGYYVGYSMCRSYYIRASNKADAIRAMIELDYSDQSAVQRFVDASGYLAP